MVAERRVWPASAGGIKMSGKGGLEVRAGVDGDDVEELVRGGGGYEGGAVTGEADGGTRGEARRGGGG